MNVRRARGPHNRAFTSLNRAMKLSAVLLAVCCWLSAVCAQWDDTLLMMPDSTGGIRNPRSLAVNPVNNRVYASGGQGGVGRSATSGGSVRAGAGSRKLVGKATIAG